MRRTSFAPRFQHVLALAAATSFGLAAMALPPVAMAQAGTGRPAALVPPVYTTTAGGLSAVAAISADNAWAVGFASDGSVLILHWNGNAWRRATGPRLPGNAVLNDVAAGSAHNVWAVGSVGIRTLILHWNGARWSRIPSPTPSGQAVLNSVTVTRSGAAWAVGAYYPQRGGTTALILRWTGRKWRQQFLPAPSNPSQAGAILLTGVAASSARNAWAVGMGDPGFWTTFARWQRGHWRVATSPNIEGGTLAAVALAPGGKAWAVGQAGSEPLIMRYTGSSWRRAHSPRAAKPARLDSVTVLRDGTAWAVGQTRQGAVALHWTGHAWQSEPVPHFSVAGTPDLALAGVAAYSDADAWAVGITSGGYGFILQWNGSSW